MADTKTTTTTTATVVVEDVDDTTANESTWILRFRDGQNEFGFMTTRAASANEARQKFIDNWQKNAVFDVKLPGGAKTVDQRWANDNATWAKVRANDLYEVPDEQLPADVKRTYECQCSVRAVDKQGIVKFTKIHRRFFTFRQVLANAWIQRVALDTMLMVATTSSV